MKKTLLKLSAFVLTLALALSCISAVAFADGESYERTVLSLASQADVNTYKWHANQATASWDASEGAFKIVTDEAKKDQRAQTTAFVPLSLTAQYKISFKAKGTAPESVSWYGNNTDDESKKLTHSYWSGTNWSITAGETDADGYTEYSGTIDFEISSNSNYNPAKKYMGMTRIMVNYPNATATNYLKDFVITTNEGEDSGYVTQGYMHMQQWGGSSGLYFTYGDAGLGENNNVYKLAATRSFNLGAAYEFEVNAKYKLSFDAWADDLTKDPASKVMLFDEKAKALTACDFTLTTDRTHYEFVVSPKDISTYKDDTTTVSYKTNNLQIRFGNVGSTYSGIYVNVTNIKLAKLTEGTVDTIVNVSAGGKLTTGVYTFTNGESMPVKKGSKVSLDIAPDEGYEIASVKYNGADVTPVSAETGSAIEFTADNDAVLNVKFSKIVPKTPEITKGNTQTAASFVVNGETKNEFNYIQYVKIDNYDASKVSAYGVDISNGTDTIRLPAVAVMPDGSFAIRVFGAAITEDGSYTFTPYLELN